MRATAKSQVGRRYAKALAALTRDRKEFQKLERDLGGFAALLQERSDLRLVLHHPALGRGEREEILSRLLKAVKPDSALTGRFLTLLIRRGRLEFLEEAIAAWREIVEERFGLISAEIVTAVPLDRAGRDRCRKRLEKITGREVRLEARANPALLGGARTRIGSRVFDGSILRQLDLLRQNFLEE